MLQRDAHTVDKVSEWLGMNEISDLFSPLF